MSLNTLGQRRTAFRNTDRAAIEARERARRERLARNYRGVSSSGYGQSRRRPQTRGRSRTRQGRRRLPTELPSGAELVYDLEGQQWDGNLPRNNRIMKNLLEKLIQKTKSNENKEIFIQTISELNDNDRNHLSQLCTITIPIASEVSDGYDENLPVAAVVATGKKRKKRKKKKLKKREI